MNPCNFSIPRLAAELKKLLSRNRNASRRFKGFIALSNRYGPRLIPFVMIVAFALSGISGLLDQSFSRVALVSAFSESIATFGSNCSTPDTSFNLGETVCAVATGAQPPISGLRQRRIQWVAPNGTVVQQADVTSNSQSNSLVIPATGQFAQVGTWSVRTIDNSGAGFASAKFFVRNPGNASVDLSIIKNGPFQAAAGSNVTYRIYVTNRGPDDAQSVVLTDGLPSNVTFVSETQISGPAANCTNPASGSSTGSSVCTIGTLPANASAVFSVTYNINAGAQDGTEISSSATVTSPTSELHQPDNTVVASTTVTGGVQTCSVSCPADITQSSDAGQCVAIVNYATPTGSGSNCNSIQCSPPSGSTFPSGTTTVTCAGESGEPCSFKVTVTGSDTQPPVITCPANITTDAASSGTARVDYPQPSASDNCSSSVTISCAPASGSVFPAGTTTVTCTAMDESNNSANCTFTVTVTQNEGECTLTCGTDITKSVDPNHCNAVVTYAAPSTTGECGTVVCSPASGSTFPIGVTLVTCTGEGGASCSFSVTVNETVPPTITTCASNKTIAADADCMGSIPDLTGEVVATDNCSAVTIIQSPVAGALVEVGDTDVTLRASDAAGNDATCTVRVRVIETTPPVITCPANVNAVDNSPGACGATVNPGTATATDNCALASVVGTRGDGGALNAIYPVGVTIITWKATDLSGNVSTCQQTVTVTNPSPAVTITGPSTGALFQVNTAVNFTATFTDNVGDTHTAQWMFDEITRSAAVVEPTISTPGSANLSHTFSAPGVYLIKLTVVDDCGNFTVSSTIAGQPAMIVIFDPDGEFVTGGGWINSPSGAYPANPGLTGRANFGFNAKYHNGDTIPRGETQFKFSNLDFRSTVYEWLVIEGPRLQYKGSGKVNGSGDYGFLLTAIDGSLSGGGGSDKFRIKIWDKNNNNAVVYDNQMNQPDTANPTTTLGGGNLVIHK
jgi:uncharacterized repeat protein (TIGR01451 family)